MKTVKVLVTALKAPWPEGTQVGSVVAFKGEVPAWAAGKYTAAPEDAKADFTYQPPELAVTDGAGPVLDSIGAVNFEVADLKTQLAAAQQANEELAGRLKAAEADLAGLQKTHDAAVKVADAEKAQHDTAIAEMRAKLMEAEAAVAKAVEGAGTATKGKAK